MRNPAGEKNFVETTNGEKTSSKRERDEKTGEEYSIHCKLRAVTIKVTAPHKAVKEVLNVKKNF